jgi:hypothetical protein
MQTHATIAKTNQLVYSANNWIHTGEVYGGFMLKPWAPARMGLCLCNGGIAPGPLVHDQVETRCVGRLSEGLRGNT